MMSINIKKRRIVSYCIVTLLMTACLTGCNGNNEAGNGNGGTAGASALLVESMDLLEASGAYSYRLETKIQQSDFLSEDVSEVSVVVTPYVAFNSTTKIGDGTKWITQVYQRENQDGSMDLFVRNTENNESEFGEWNLNHIEPEFAELIISNGKENVKYYAELLRANKTLFKEDENEQVEGKNTIVLKGAITPDSAAKVYNDYLRDYYREFGLVEDKNLTAEEAKNEIVTSGILELQSGIPALAFSPNNIPLTIWIDAESHAPIKLELDKTDVMQMLIGVEKVEKVVTTYKLLELGTLVTIPAPEGVE